MKKLVFLSVIGLGACVSKAVRQETARNREEAENFAKSLRIGMTKSEVTKLNPNLGNCEGSEKSVERCRISFWTGSQASIAYDAKTDYARDKFKELTLTFAQGKLQHWEETDSSRFHGDTSGFRH